MFISQYLSLNIPDQINIFNWEISIYHDFVLFIESLISLIVVRIIYMCFISSIEHKVYHWRFLEILWRFLPGIVLIFLGFPAIKLLYISEAYRYSSLINLKVIGHQWYWEYTFREFKVKFEAYPIILSRLLRLGETSRTLVFPFTCSIRIIITSFDVLHSWAIPSLGVKIDACPGRLNFIILNCFKPGVFVGQCRELCGNFHHLIPIYLEVTSHNLFLEWLKAKI